MSVKQVWISEVAVAFCSKHESTNLAIACRTEARTGVTRVRFEQGPTCTQKRYHYTSLVGMYKS
jgi:hypothetical protein